MEKKEGNTIIYNYSWPGQHLTESRSWVLGQRSLNKVLGVQSGIIVATRGRSVLHDVVDVTVSERAILGSSIASSIHKLVEYGRHFNARLKV